MNNKMYIIIQKDSLEETNNKINTLKNLCLLDRIIKSNIADLSNFEFNEGTLWEFKLEEIKKAVSYFHNDSIIAKQKNNGKNF